MTDINELAKNVILQEANALELLAEDFPIDFEAAIKAILQCKGNVIVSGIGKSGHVGKKIAASFASTGTRAFFVHSSEASHGDLGMVSEDDILLVLSNSGNTHELTDLINYALLKQIPIISITKNLDSILAKSSSYILKLPDIPEVSEIGAPTTSTTLMIAMGDALKVALAKLKNFKKEDFKIFHPGGTLGKTL